MAPAQTLELRSAAITANATTTVTSASFTPAVGDLLVVKATTNLQTVVPGTPSTSAGGLTPWTLSVTVSPTASCPIRVWTARVLVSAAMTLSTAVASTSTSTGNLEAVVERWPNATTGATASTNTSATPSGSITTTTAGSAVSWVVADYNGATTAPTYLGVSPTNDIAAGPYQVSGVLSAYTVYQQTSTAGSTQYGTSAPASTNTSSGAIEIVPAGTGTAIPTEDASTPPVVRTTYGTATTATTASFSPPASTVLVALVSVGWNAAPTVAAQGGITVADSSGANWTKTADVPPPSGSYSEVAIYTRVLSATAPGAITVTATSATTSANAGKTMALAVRVLTGASGVGTATTAANNTVSLTTTQANSLAYVVAGNGGTTAETIAATTSSLFTLLDSGASGDSLYIGESTARTGTPGATSLGWTGSGTGYVAAAIEVLPAAVQSVAISTLVDTFSTGTLAAEWIANGAGVTGGGAYVSVSQNAGTPVYSSLRSQPNKQWAGYAIAFEIGSMPGVAGTSSAAGDTAGAQFWIRDPNTTNTVDRLGAEYAAAANTLTLRGQTQGYAAIGTDVVLTYDPIAHRWLKLDQTTSGTVVWSTSPDGLTWTVQRTLTSAPAWTAKTTLQFDVEGFRSTGTNDWVRIDNLNVAPTPLPTTAPGYADALQQRTLTEVRAWESWLSTNSARGYVGEFGWVTLWSKFGNPTMGGQWSGLGNVYLTELDYAGLSGTVWAAGRNWGNGYTLGSAVGNNIGDPLTIFNTDASPIPAHRTRGAGTSTRWRGVGLSGYEAGMNIAGGGTVRSSSPYLHTAADFAFLAANGIDTVRLALAWERVQPTLGAALSTTALTTIDGMLTAARQAGVRVILDIHNYGRYTQADGATVVSISGGGITDAQFSTLWTLLSTWVMGNPTRSGTVIGYGLMNEPHDLPNGASGWQTTAQAALTAIRNNGDAHLITVAGYQFASLTSWAKNHPSGWITDPGTTTAPVANFVYEAHHYWDTVSAYGSRSGTYQQRNADQSISTETYATELASCTPTTTTDTPSGAQQGLPAEAPYARPQGPIDQPSGADQGTPGDAQAISIVRADAPIGAGQGTPRDTAAAGTVVTDTPVGTQQGVEADQTVGSAVINETPESQDTESPGEVELPLPPTLTVGDVGPTELDLTVAQAPQVAEATLRWYGWLGSAFIDGDQHAGYPLLRFLESGGRLLQNLEDLTRDANTAPGWSALFDLTRAPTYALPWMGQTVGVDVDPTIPDAAQRQQIVTESGYMRGTVGAVEAVALSWLQGPTPTVEITERDGNEWTVTVAVYAAQLVGRTYASLSQLYPTYAALSGAFGNYQTYSVGYSELYQALQQVKPAGLILKLIVRTGPSYAALTGGYRTYAALSAAYPTYSAMTGSQPVTA